jgi:hypothetical protein
MYSTAPAQEQGARLPARCHRWLDFSQNSGQQQSVYLLAINSNSDKFIIRNSLLT